MTTPYRDDFDALRDRFTSLQQELSAIKTRTRELTELQQAESQMEREIETLRRRLEGMAARRSLPILEHIRIASPCKADWNAMTGDERKRFCDQCDKHVYNLSGMSREEAERLICDTETQVCVRLFRRADGTVLTNDCAVGAKRVRRRRAIAATVGGGMLAAGSLLAWQETHMMGAVRSAGSDRDLEERMEQRMGELDVTHTMGVVAIHEPDDSTPPEPEQASLPKKPASPRERVLPQRLKIQSWTPNPRANQQPPPAAVKIPTRSTPRRAF
jgi:hypothetical protein